MKSTKVTLLFFLVLTIYGQSGLPLFKSYYEEHHHSYPVMRWITEDPQGIMYFANKNGIVRYNGEIWDEIPTYTPALCVAVDPETDVIYVGGKEDFGIIIPNEAGKLTYSSLVKSLTKKESKTLKEVDRVFIVDGKAFFVSSYTEYIYIVDYSGGQIPDVSAKKFNGIIRGSGKVGNSLYVNISGEGLMRYTNGKWEKVSSQFANTDIATIIGIGKGIGLIANYHTGELYEIRGRQITKYTPESANYLAKHKVYEMTHLGDKVVAIATYNGGVVVYDHKTGKTLYKLNKNTGFPDDDMYFVYGNPKVGLWAAHTKGITHVNTNFPVFSYKHIPGLEGKINDMQMYNGKLYLATMQGVFVFVGNRFVKVRSLDAECWDLQVGNGKLLVASTSGVFEIIGNTAKQIGKGIALKLVPSRFNKNKMYVILSVKVGELEYSGGSWKVKQTFKNIFESTNSIVEKDKNILLLGTDYKGLIIYDKKKAEIKRVNLKKVLNVPSNYIKLFQIKDQIYAILSNGVYYIKGEEILLDEKAANLLKEYGITNPKNIIIQGNILFLSEKNKALRIKINGFGDYKVEELKPLGIFNKKVERIYETPEIWFSIHDELYRYSRRKFEEFKQKFPKFLDFNVVVSKIVVGKDSIIFNGYYLDEKGYPTYDILKVRDNWYFTHKENNLTFYVGATSYFNEDLNEFQYKLEGSDEDWSPWQKSGKLELKNIPEGDYELIVRARNFMGVTQERKIMKFTVAPPWYRHPAAYVGYIALLGVLVALIVHLNTRRLEARNKELQQLVDERTKEIRKQRDELEKTLMELQATQQQLIQSEKLAALGQLVAGVAHEINTPLGAINASATNLKTSLPQALKDLPDIVAKLNDDEVALLKEMIKITMDYESQLTSREERKLKRSLKAELEAEGIDGKYAADLVKVGLYDKWRIFLPLLKHSEAPNIIRVITTLGKVNVNLGNILLAVKKTQRIVSALKMYTYRSMDEEKVELDVEQNIETVLTIYHNQLKQGVNVEVEVEPNLPKIKGYPDELNQVWTNIIHNAIQAMKGKGNLKIKIEKAGDNQIAVHITDSGPGIPPEIINKIFEPFFTTKGQGEGSGLGLSITRKIVEEKHGGKISVKSQPGETTFSVFLPIETTESVSS